jgi:hypothetical protein
MFLAFLIIVIIIFKKTFWNFVLKWLKVDLNTKYLNDFPYVNISTKSGNFNGKIVDIFDDNMILLYNAGTKISTEWNQIIFMELLKS